VAAADAALARRDAATTLVMIQAARAQLGDIAERFNGAALAPERERVATASYALADVGDLVRRGAQAADGSLDAWLATSPRWRAPLLKAEARSLYEPGRLTAALTAGPPV
jgi:hypothetical protein